MNTTDHPVSEDRTASLADERGVAVGELDDALARVQRSIAREDDGPEYEYSSRHNFGWEGEDAYYLYGDGVWEVLGENLSFSDGLRDAAREVHREAMLESAADRGERETVEGMFADGNEPLVVANVASEPPLFGQDV